jgi:hypothetical protein
LAPTGLGLAEALKQAARDTRGSTGFEFDRVQATGL